MAIRHYSTPHDTFAYTYITHEYLANVYRRGEWQFAHTRDISPTQRTIKQFLPLRKQGKFLTVTH